MINIDSILVTGGSGFIGSNFLNIFVQRYPEVQFINVDKLTYAANQFNLTAVSQLPNYQFERSDIADFNSIRAVFEKYLPDVIVHFAAESHVDRSLVGPAEFIYSNIIGTFNLLELCRKHLDKESLNRFHHVSTDEVYGSLGKMGLFSESTAYDPSSPYSASKASSDHLVRAYFRSYGIPVTISNCSNNYGPMQFPEKLIPLMILNALTGKELPVYGQGINVRDWLYVNDHCEAIWRILQDGIPGETYNVGGNCEKMNLEVVNRICEIVAEYTGSSVPAKKNLIRFVTDRPGHDLRYAIDSSKISSELGWSPTESFESGLRKTVKWYLENPEWVSNVQSGEYANWVRSNYSTRSK